MGCDWVVDSDAQEDKCGVCHGGGDQCDTLSGVFEKEQGQGKKKIRCPKTEGSFFLTGYEEVVSIPEGARNIFIEELGPSKNYIGIGSETSEEFYLNGKLYVNLQILS